MSDYTKLPRDIADCMSRAGSPLSEDQRLLLAGYLAPVQQKLADSEARVAEFNQLLAGSSEAYILRKQAEAVENEADQWVGHDGPFSGRSVEKEIRDYAVMLRQQADEAERAGGEVLTTAPKD